MLIFLDTEFTDFVWPDMAVASRLLRTVPNHAQKCQENSELSPRLADDIVLSIDVVKAGQVIAYKFGKLEQ